VIYAGSYGGTIDRVDLRTGHTRSIMVYPQMALGNAARDLEYRFQWNAPIRISPHDPNVVYMTSQHVHKTTNEGQSWERVSPDLTRNDAEKQDFPGQPITNDATGVEVYDGSSRSNRRIRRGARAARRRAGASTRETAGELDRRDAERPSRVEHGERHRASPHALPGLYRRLSLSLHDFKPYIFENDDFG
jgi:hypothetical protein